jgi:hypothetical protein
MAKEKKRKVPLGDELVDAVEVDFAPLREDWNEYSLADGTRLKMKIVITKVFRTEKYNPQGEPIYLVNSTNILNASVADDLLGKNPEDM